MASAAGSSFEPGAADASAFALLSSARRSLDLIRAGEQQDRVILFSTAISALTALQELHGCEWAAVPLRELYAMDECPDLHIGHSVDGRLSLRLQRLELFNPAFDEYTLYLATLEGNTSQVLEGGAPAALNLELLDGSPISAEAVTAQHPLWPRLERLAGTFDPPAQVVPGVAVSFKQVYSVPRLSRRDIAAASLRWGDYDLRVRFREHDGSTATADIL
jgi:hypothetical protein